MKQVTYTFLNGVSKTFTVNTALQTYSLLGNSVSGITDQESISRLQANAEVTKTRTCPKIGSTEPVEVTTYYTLTNAYVTDYGLQFWAKERLSYDEYKNFTGQVAIATARTGTASDNSGFMYWWKRYISDPNVVVEQ